VLCDAHDHGDLRSNMLFQVICDGHDHGDSHFNMLFQEEE
jgi:hypothetical protein